MHAQKNQVRICISSNPQRRASYSSRGMQSKRSSPCYERAIELRHRDTGYSRLPWAVLLVSMNLQADVDISDAPISAVAVRTKVKQRAMGPRKPTRPYLLF